MATDKRDDMSPSRRNAEEAFAKQQRSEAAFFEERRKKEAENREKTLHLRSLRLAKEAAERVAAEAAAATTPKRPSRRIRNPSH